MMGHSLQMLHLAWCLAVSAAATRCRTGSHTIDWGSKRIQSRNMAASSSGLLLAWIQKPMTTNWMGSNKKKIFQMWFCFSYSSNNTYSLDFHQGSSLPLRLRTILIGFWFYCNQMWNLDFRSYSLQKFPAFWNLSQQEGHWTLLMKCHINWPISTDAHRSFKFGWTNSWK